MSVAAAVAIVVGTAVSIDASQKAASASREKGRVIGAQQRIEDAAARRKQARQARIQRAQIEQTAEATGTSDSSKEIGAASALETQVAGDVARGAGQVKTAEGIGAQNQNIANAQAQSQLGQGIQSVGSVAFSATGGFDNLFKD